MILIIDQTYRFPRALRAGRSDALRAGTAHDSTEAYDIKVGSIDGRFLEMSFFYTIPRRLYIQVVAVLPSQPWRAHV